MGGASGKLRNVKNENPHTHWMIAGDLGAGTYGKVHKVRQRRRRLWWGGVGQQQRGERERGREREEVKDGPGRERRGRERAEVHTDAADEV